MSVAHALLAFTITAGLLTVTPGLDTALVLRTAAVEGKRRAMQAGTGICSGILVWGLATSMGFSAVLALSKSAFTALRLVGACYLLYLGAGLFLCPRTTPEERVRAAPHPTLQDRPNWFTRGFLTNLLNPKVGIFYISFLPQFIPGGVQVLQFSMLLAFIHAAEGILWFLLLSSAADFVSQWLRHPSVAVALDRVTGGIFIGFGIKLGLERGQ